VADELKTLEEQLTLFPWAAAGVLRADLKQNYIRLFLTVTNPQEAALFIFHEPFIS
jgi:hypothetical protein